MTAQVGAVCVCVCVCVFVSCSLCRLIVVSCAILLVCVLVSCISRNTIGNIALCRYCLSFALYAFKVQPLFLHLLRASEFACSAYLSFSMCKVVNVMVCVFRGLVYTLTFVPLLDSHLVRCIYELSSEFFPFFCTLYHGLLNGRMVGQSCRCERSPIFYYSSSFMHLKLFHSFKTFQAAAL